MLSAREAFVRGDWHAAGGLFRVAQSIGELDTDDLDLLSRAMWFLGEVSASMEESERALGRLVAERRPLRAAGRSAACARVDHAR